MKKILIIGTLLSLILTGCAKQDADVIDTLEPTTIPSAIAYVELEAEVTVENEPVFYLTDYERWVAECMVMGESGGEDYIGQVLVAQCILNACLNDDVQPSEVRTLYKYSGWNEDISDSVKDAVSAVFDDGYTYVDEFILYFYAPKYSKGKFHNTQRFVLEHGGHRFYTPWG